MITKALRIGEGKRSFAKHVLTMMSGRTLAFAINFLLTPIIARLFEPQDFGVTALFLAISTTIGPLSCFRYDKAVQVAKEGGEANQIAVLSLGLTLAVAGLMWAATPLVTVLDWGPETLRRLGGWIWLLPLGVILEGHTAVLESWLTRARRFTSQASAEVLQSLSRTTARIAYGLTLGSSVSGLIGSYLFAYGLKGALLFDYSRRAPKLHLNVESPSTYRGLAARYSDFPRYSTPTAFIVSATTSLPVFVLAAFFDPQTVGFFGMADRVIRTPTHVTANSVRTVFLQRIAEINNAGRPIRRPTLQTAAVLGAVALVPCLVLWLFGQEIITTLLGPRWETAGHYCEIMAPYVFFQWLGPPFQAAAVVMREQRLWFHLQVWTAVSRLAVIPMALWLTTSPEAIIQAYIWLTIAGQVLAMVMIGLRLEGRRRAPAA